MRTEGAVGFVLLAAQIRNDIYNPRYYDPSIEERLDELSPSHELVSLRELMETGELQLRQGKYIDKLNYGTGPVPYIRTSDIANWEIRAAPKHGMSEAVASKYRDFMDVQEMDVLLVHEGTYLVGTPCLITRFDTDILFQHHLAKMRAKGDRITGSLLVACLLSPIVQRQIRARQFTADVIDSIVGRLPEVRIPLHRSQDRRRSLAELARIIFSGRAEARVRLALLSRELDEAIALGMCDQLADKVSSADVSGSGHVSFLGDRSPAESFVVGSHDIRGHVLVPRYYDPIAGIELKQLGQRCDLVTIGDLVGEGVLELHTGDEVGKLAYGGGDVAFVRTSDFGNWEIKHDPKQRISRDAYDQYAGSQSAKVGDLLLVRDGTYLVGTTTIVQEDDLPLLYSGGIYRIRVADSQRLSPALLLALMNMRVVRRQMRNKQFTRDVIDTLGHRFLEVVIPIPSDPQDRQLIGSTMQHLLDTRESLRRQAGALGAAVEAL